LGIEAWVLVPPKVTINPNCMPINGNSMETGRDSGAFADDRQELPIRWRSTRRIRENHRGTRGGRPVFVCESSPTIERET
jgi:hypothetical protein